MQFDEPQFLQKGGKKLRISILIVDDQPAVGIGMKNMIVRHLHANILVVHTEKKAMESMKQQPFDIVLCSWKLPLHNGIELSEQLIRLQPNMKAIIYSGYSLEHQIHAMLDAGITGFVYNSNSSYDLANAIKFVMQDNAIFPIPMLQQLRQKHNMLTEKENELLIEIVRGFSNRELAEKFHITQRAVEYQISKLYDKLQVRSRAKAIIKAAAMGMYPYKD